MDEDKKEAEAGDADKCVKDGYAALMSCAMLVALKHSFIMGDILGGLFLFSRKGDRTRTLLPIYHVPCRSARQACHVLLPHIGLVPLQTGRDYKRQRERGPGGDTGGSDPCRAGPAAAVSEEHQDAR
jgi:hypothetical protein